MQQINPSDRAGSGNTAVFVIGVNYTGKSYFIEKQGFKKRGWAVLDILDYQERTVRDDELKRLELRERLYRANEMLKNDALDLLRQGRDVLIEQTFYRAMRRIDYIEDIRELGIPVVVYVMMPSDRQLRKNCEKRSQHTVDDPEYVYERVRDERICSFEFPNPAEGFSRIYEVTDDGIKERHDEPDWEHVKKAEEKLKQDRRERAERLEAERQHEELVRKTEHIRFWHYCETCGKKELLTADEAFERGWDYPPKIGKFRLLSPRTCGECTIENTLWFKLICGNVNWDELTDSEKETLERIRNEPEGLMPGEGEL